MIEMRAILAMYRVVRMIFFCNVTKIHTSTSILMSLKENAMAYDIYKSITFRYSEGSLLRRLVIPNRA